MLCHSLFEHMTEGVAFCRMLFDDEGQPADYINVQVNPAFEELTGLRDTVGRRITEAIPGIREANPELFETYGRVVRTGVPERFETYVPGIGRWFAISAFRPQAGHFAAVFENISEHRRVDEALRESEQRYRTVVEDLAEGVIVHDAAGRIVASNPAARAILGLEIDEITGLTASDPAWNAVWADGTPTHGENHPATIARTSGQPVTGVVMGIRHSSGATRWVQVSAQPLRDATGGTVTGAVASFNDITEARRAEHALRASEAAMRGSLDAMADPFLICEPARDPDGVLVDFRTVFGNRAAAAFMGQSQEALIGALIPEGMPDLGGRPLRAVLRDVIETGEGWAADGAEFMVPGPDGGARRLVVNVQVGRFADGLFLAWRDVTERERLGNERERLAAIIENSADGIVITDADHHITYANAAFLADAGRTMPEITGLSMHELMRGITPSVTVDDVDRRLIAGQPWVGEIDLRRPSGASRRVEVSVTPNDDQEGVLSGWVSVFRDVTDLREAEAEVTLEARIRVALAEGLQAIPEDASVVEAAQAICEQLATLPFIGLAAIEAFTGADEVLIIAQGGPPGYPVPTGTALRPGRAAIVRARSQAGPWSEYVTRDPADGWLAGDVAAGLRAVAYGPIRHGDHVDGALVIGTFDEPFARTLVEKMPGIVSLSMTSSALLADRLHDLRREAGLRDEIGALLASSAFHPVFQPIVDLLSGEAVGYEALSRFDSGQRPDLCFADAWSVGLGAELELATLAAAVEAGKQLPAGAWLDLNVSPRLLAEPGRLREILWEAGRPLVLEVTEHELIDDYDVVREAVRELGHDIRLAVDDAGAGVANFGHIIDLRPDFVKLDIGLVRRVNANLGRQAMVVGMRHFARTAGCRLIAEGVETVEEAATLTALGVEFGQGYLFGRPEPVDAWTAPGTP